MKISLTIFILYFSIPFYGQNAEQIAVDYFASNIISEFEGIRVRYDGRIQKFKNKLDTAKGLIHDYFGCRFSNPDYTSEKGIEKYDEIYSEIANSKSIIYSKTPDIDLNVPNKIKFRKKLKFRSSKTGGLNFYSNKYWHSIFPFKYNLFVEPAVKYKDYTYIRLTATKNNKIEGVIVIVRLNEESMPVDWCEQWWIE